MMNPYPLKFDFNVDIDERYGFVLWECVLYAFNGFKMLLLRTSKNLFGNDVTPK